MKRWIWCVTAMLMAGKIVCAINSNDILPPHKLRAGMKGYGLSVFHGTKIEKFPITILGVMEKFDFDMDAILIRIDGGTVVKRKSGVISGMSGSPIFVNGKLIGAISFGWFFPKEPVAGVTPITAMLACTDPKKFPSPRFTTGSLKPKSGPITVSGRSIHRFWIASSMKEADQMRQRLRKDEGLLIPVATPLLVSGVPRSVIPLLQRMLEPYNVIVLEGVGGSGSLPVKDAPIKPGSALGVRLIGGDMDFSGVGTATWVEGNKVLAFGHPMFGFGKIDMPMTSGYVTDIISSYAFSFKMAVSLKNRGRLTQDRAFAVAGELGKPSETLPMQVSLQNFAQHLRRRYNLELVRHKDIVNIAAYIGLLGPLFNYVSPSEEGSIFMKLQVEAEGFPPIVRENWFPNEGVGMGFFFSPMEFGRTSPLGELADIMEALVNNRFGEVKFNNIKADVEFYPQRRTAWIDRVTTHRMKVKLGQKVPVSLTIKGWGNFERTVKVNLEVPANARPGRMRFLIGGGMLGEVLRRQAGYRRPHPRSLKDLWKQLQDVYSNNEIVVASNPLTSGVEIVDKRWESLPSPIIETLTNMGSSEITLIRDYREKRSSFDRILTSIVPFTVTVEADEKEKEAPPRPPTATQQTPSQIAQVEEPSQSVTEEGGEEEIVSLWQRLALMPPIHNRWLDPVERVWSEIQLAKFKWTVGQWMDMKGFRLPIPTTLRPQKQTYEWQPPQPPSWEEVQQLSPEQMEQQDEQNGQEEQQSHQPSQPSQSAKPTQPSARSQPLARPPKTWVLAKGEDWLKGKLDGAIVSTDGTITLGYQIHKVCASEGMIGAFTLVPTQDCGFYVGTLGPAGVLYVNAKGEIKTVVKLPEESVVTALAISPKGDLFYATAPGGCVFQLTKGNDTPKSICKLNKKTVWAFSFFDHDTLVLATGPEGEVFTVGLKSEEIEPKLLVQLPERHAIALAKSLDGGIYVGTNPRGKVYRLMPDGKAVTVFETLKDSIHALAVDGKGNLFIGTSGSATVYLLDSEGRWRELRRFASDRHIMALFGQPEGVLVATGSSGKLYQLSSNGVATLLYDSEQSYLLSVGQTNGVIATILSNPAEIALLEHKADGEYKSFVQDMGQISRFGVIRFVADIPQGAQLILQTRSGNTSYPDKTWSDWSNGYTTSGQTIESPPGRYIQVRALLKANGELKSPILKRLEVVYLPKNQRPKLTVQEPTAGATVSSKVNIKWRGEDPDKDRLVFEVFYSIDGKTWEQILEEKPKGKSSTEKTNPKQSGEDETEEETPAEKPEGEQKPSATTKTSIQWDTTKIPDGIYLLKVVASDKTANPDDPQTAEQIITPVKVDNTPPVISWLTAKHEGDKLFLPCYDGSAITSAEYRNEGAEWIAAICQDGVFDQPYEVLTLNLSQLPKDTKTLEVRARDAAGNEQTVKFSLPY